MMDYSTQIGSTFVLLDDTSEDVLAENISRFFMILRKKDGSFYNASSLGTFYQSLSRHLSKRESPIDIKTDIRFRCVRDIVSIKCTESAEGGERPGKHAANSIEPAVLKKAYLQGVLGKSNPRALITTVHWIMNHGFGLRSIKEVYGVVNSDIIFGPEVRPGLPGYISLEERVTKTRKGQKNAIRDVQSRVWLDDDNPDLCNVRTVLEYMKRKTDKQNQPDIPFLLGVKQSAQRCPEKEVFWYIDVRMGVNTIASLLKKAMEAVGIDCKKEKISSYSARKTLIQSGADSLTPGSFVSKMAGQKNLASKLDYLRNKETTHKAASLCMSRQAAGIGGDFRDVYNQIKADNIGSKDSECGNVGSKDFECGNVGSNDPLQPNMDEVNVSVEPLVEDQCDEEDDFPVISQSKFHESPKKKLIMEELKFREEKNLDISQFLYNQQAMTTQMMNQQMINQQIMTNQLLLMNQQMMQQQNQFNNHASRLSHASQNYGTYHYVPQSTYATQVVSSTTYQQEAVDSTWIDDFDFGLL